MTKRRVLLAWELGAGYGHLASLHSLARELARRQVETVWAVRHLDDAARFLGTGRTLPLPTLLQAPFSQTPPAAAAAAAPQLSYASLLHRCGFHDATLLATQLSAWRALMQLVQADLVMAEHAPTALLAAHSLQLPCALLGTGFTVPPACAPFPAFHQAATQEVMQANEAVVLAVAQRALSRLHAPPLQALQDLIPTTPPGLFTYPETDHYGDHRHDGHLGLPRETQGAKVHWPERPGTKVLAMLDWQPSLSNWMPALSAAPLQVLIKARGWPEAARTAWQRQGLVVTEAAIDLHQAIEGCDVFLSQGSHGSVVEALLAGKPMLLLPTHREQQLLSERIARLGAGLCLSNPDAAGFAAALHQLLEDPRLRTAAETIAKRHAGLDREAILSHWCDAVLGR